MSSANNAFKNGTTFLRYKKENPFRGVAEYNKKYKLNRYISNGLLIIFAFVIGSFVIGYEEFKLCIAESARHILGEFHIDLAIYILQATTFGVLFSIAAMASKFLSYLMSPILDFGFRLDGEEIYVDIVVDHKRPVIDVKIQSIVVSANVDFSKNFVFFSNHIEEMHEKLIDTGVSPKKELEKKMEILRIPSNFGFAKNGPSLFSFEIDNFQTSYILSDSSSQPMFIFVNITYTTSFLGVRSEVSRILKGSDVIEEKKKTLRK